MAASTPPGVDGGSRMRRELVTKPDHRLGDGTLGLRVLFAKLSGVDGPLVVDDQGPRLCVHQRERKRLPAGQQSCGPKRALRR